MHYSFKYILRNPFCNSVGGFRPSRPLYTHYIQLTNKPQINKKPEPETAISQLIQKHQQKIIYNTIVYKEYPELSSCKPYMVLKRIATEKWKTRRELASIEPLPIALKYTTDYAPSGDEPATEASPIENEDVIQFPYGEHNTTPLRRNRKQRELVNIEENVADISEREVRTRQEALKHSNTRDWMTAYENYDEVDDESEVADHWNINYGTPDPNSHVSTVPCGGCGALLHCKDTSIPGYIPSEIYRNCFKTEGIDLQSLICQRCYFLKTYNVALQVRVANKDYQRVLETIKDKRALIVLIVDLLDFPCSIWPGIADVLGTKKPIIVVGNKVDLLPRDGSAYLNRIKELLKETVLETVSHKSVANIKHVGLISAKTGWGVEELINKMHNLWQYRGDVYLVGSTNVGKSSLFNCLLQSDYCKVQAVDLVQRATTSVWPGTTLNLLKFPILRPSGWRLFLRTKRLQSIRKLTAAEEKLNKIQLRETNNPKYATLMGRLERTFTDLEEPNDLKDPFSVSGNPNSDGKIQLGINEHHPDYIASKWCYDTPGVVQETQIIHLLTTEELMLTLPRTLIQPKSFNVRVGQTLFIAGIGRVDYTTGPDIIKLTVFCANTLPITMCNTDDASLLYKEFLGTEIFQVPKGTHDRLNQWPPLEMKGPFKLIGSSDYTSCGDIVLSNAGWIAVQCEPECEVVLNAWTPQARGIYSRKSLLPYIVKLKGTKIRKTPMYIHDKVFIPQW